MRPEGDPDDYALLALLDTGDARTDAWERLLALAEEFEAVPHRDDDCTWNRAQKVPGNRVAPGYPVYGVRVNQACRALAEVGAVTPAFHWMSHPAPEVVAGKDLAPADAIRLATATIRGERFCDGTIGEALSNGSLQAVLVALAGWYRTQPHP